MAICKKNVTQLGAVWFVSGYCKARTFPHRAVERHI